MATQSDATRGAAAQADYSKIRRPPEKDDVVLNAAALALLESVDESVRPKQLPVSFPRIVNRMAELWRRPVQMDRYFDELVTDARGKRQGFPLKILMELRTLKDYYQVKVFSSRHAGRDAAGGRERR